jgi:hypothetical protein
MIKVSVAVMPIARRLLPLVALACSVIASPGKADDTLLSSNALFYDRLVRLDHQPDADQRGMIIAAGTAAAPPATGTAAAPSGGLQVGIFTGDIAGTSFSPLGTIADPEFATGLCCGTLYELPRQIGALRPGVLLWAGAVGQNTVPQRMKIKVYRSEDGGALWSYLSEVTTPLTGGLWEPEFTVAADGALVMFFSDQTEQPLYAQTLKKVRTYDGVNWKDMIHVVASPVSTDAPGMAIVRRLSDGRWMMTYEFGGSAHQWIAHYRLSQDGWNWGDAQDLGTAIQLPTGEFPAHTPTFTVMRDGAIVLAAQLIENPGSLPNESLSPLSGRVLLVNRSGRPETPWTTMIAPVPVPDACSQNCPTPPGGKKPIPESCPNYSSPLLPTRDGLAVLEFASDWLIGEDGKYACLTSYGSAPLYDR